MDNCTLCESEPSCSDSPLSITSNVIGILTFAYAIALGVPLLALQLGGSVAEIKRLGKAVAFLKPRIDHLNRHSHPTTTPLQRRTPPLELKGGLKTMMKRSVEPRELREASLTKISTSDFKASSQIFKPLFDSAVYLWSEPEIKRHKTI
ncbi:hypothetical protein B0T14DRAFT_520669 [Immersiella caudata]|uniref:Uncharacterized protein n=1 Tax=Immersiella caudata TaxID=314043 RepID=A0AA39WRA8_9PEZI|nr:hypothetical protein B0T14DRAFT_520669 [Immersiella caudata]